MIENFVHKGLERYFRDGTKKGIVPQHAQQLADILDLLEAAATISDMNFPGGHLHPLKGQLRGLWAVNVSGNWRVVFRFRNGNASDVDYVDYH